MGIIPGTEREATIRRIYTVRDTTHDGVPTITLVSPDGVDAAFAPGVGMVGCSFRLDGTELLGMRGGLAAYRDHGTTFGIPLLHPWANRLNGFLYEAAGAIVVLDRFSKALHLDDNGLPIHGVVAAAPDWEVTGREATQHHAELRARLDFGADADRLATFPFPHQVELRISLRGSTLQIDTTIVAGRDSDVPLSFGWHPYVTMPDEDRINWHVQLPATERLELDPRGIPTGQRQSVASLKDNPLDDFEFDDAYADVAPGADFTVTAAGRRVTVCFDEGYPYLQVYAPGTLDVIAYEPMTAPTNALVTGDHLRLVPAGGRETATFSISAEYFEDEDE